MYFDGLSLFKELNDHDYAKIVYPCMRGIRIYRFGLDKAVAATPLVSVFDWHNRVNSLESKE